MALDKKTAKTAAITICVPHTLLDFIERSRGYENRSSFISRELCKHFGVVME